jgi:hypothetical protein
MYALGTYFSEAVTDSSLAWLLWIVLGIFVLAMIAGWGASLSRPKQDHVARAAPENVPPTSPARARPGTRKAPARLVARQKRKSR